MQLFSIMQHLFSCSFVLAFYFSFTYIVMIWARYFPKNIFITINITR